MDAAHQLQGCIHAFPNRSTSPANGSKAPCPDAQESPDFAALHPGYGFSKLRSTTKVSLPSGAPPRTVHFMDEMSERTGKAGFCSCNTCISAIHGGHIHSVFEGAHPTANGLQAHTSRLVPLSWLSLQTLYSKPFVSSLS